MEKNLTVKEVAKLKNCSAQYVRKLISDGKLNFITENCKGNNKKKFLISVDDLPDDLRTKYYRELNKNVMYKAIEQNQLQECYQSYEDFTADERNQIDLWVKILSFWQENRLIFDKKVMADEQIIGAINLKLKKDGYNLVVSQSMLYRKYNHYKNGDLKSLIGKSGGHNKGKSIIDDRVWQGFLAFYLDDRRPTLSDVYKSTKLWTSEFYPELYDSLPSEMTFRRHLKSDVPEAIIQYLRYGEKALKDKCLPYIERLYDDLKVNDVWVTDNHTLDIQTAYDDRDGLHRLYITGFFDAKSGILTGWNITDNPSVNSTIFAMRHGIKRTGTLPKVIYSDNGSEFMSYDYAGRGRRKKTPEKTLDYSMTILGRLGIELKIAQVRNARAKPIERFFLDFKNHISKMITSYTGGNVTERPESLKKRIKNGEVPVDSEIRTIINEMVELENANLYGGSEKKYKGLTKIEVYNRCVKDTTMIRVSDNDLNLMLMRTATVQKVKRRGVKITVSSEDVWYMSEDTWLMQGKEVYVRYDPTDLSTARIYDKDDKYIATWEVDRTLMLMFMENDAVQLADANKKLAQNLKAVKQYAKDMFEAMRPETKIDMLDVKIRRHHELARDGKLVLEQSNAISIRRNEEKYVYDNAELKKTGTDAAVIIDINKMNKNLERKK